MRLELPFGGNGSNARTNHEPHPPGVLRHHADLSAATSVPTLLSQSRVVVVDDSAANLRVLTRLLEDAGLTAVEGFTEGRYALDRCLDVPPDLLLLDLRMPELDGFAVLRALRSSLPAGAFLPVLVLTGDDDSETRQRALAAGAGPAGPVKPIGPCGPVAPVAPVSPLSPFKPCGPCGPTAPSAPAGP